MPSKASVAAAVVDHSLGLAVLDCREKHKLLCWNSHRQTQSNFVSPGLTSTAPFVILHCTAGVHRKSQPVSCAGATACRNQFETDLPPEKLYEMACHNTGKA